MEVEMVDIVNFTRDVILYDAENDFCSVRVKKGSYKMVNGDNPLRDRAVITLGPWIMIRGSKIGMSYIAFEKLGFEIREVRETNPTKQKE